WLHHANIDRLWEVWRKNPSSHVDPVDPDWVKGSASIGERKFSMPMPGGKAWDYTPGDVKDLKKLGYKYDDVSASAPKTLSPAARMKQLKVSAAVAKKAAKVRGAAQGRNVELVGATSAPLKLSGGETSSSVPLDPPTRRKIATSLVK